MNKSNVVLLVFSLSNLELKQFRLWVKSDLHNSRKELVRLLDWIVKFQGKSDLSKMTREGAFKFVFPKQDYDDKQLRYAMSFLLQQLRDFLSWKMLQANEIQQQQYLLMTLRQRKLKKLYEQQLKKAKQSIENQQNRNIEYYFNQYQLQLEAYESLQTQNRSKTFPLKEISEYFTIYMITNTLKLQCKILAHKSVSQTEYDVQVFEKLLDLLEKGIYQNVPSIQIYYNIYQSLTTWNISFYTKLKQLILLYFHQFPLNEIGDILILTINFCIKKLNKGETEFLKEAFDWYKKGFDENVLIKDGELSRFTFNNVMIIGLKLKEYEWTKQFLETHKKYIATTHQHDTYYFNLALWHQYQNQFDEALELLLQVDFTDVLHALQAKRLMIAIYYKIEAFTALESLLASIKVYLYRHKNLGYHLQDYLKLIRYVKKLIQLNPHDKTAKEKLRQAIENEKSLLDKRWFLECLNVTNL